jgi:hypothetical protein
MLKTSSQRDESIKLFLKISARKVLPELGVELVRAQLVFCKILGVRKSVQFGVFAHLLIPEHTDTVTSIYVSFFSKRQTARIQQRARLVKSFIKGFSVSIIYETGKTHEPAL